MPAHVAVDRQALGSIVIISQILDKSRIGVFFVFILFKFIVDNNQGFLRYRYINIFMDIIMIVSIPVFPKYNCKECVCVLLANGP